MTLMCQVLEVSRTGYYDWITRPVSTRSRRHAALAVDVRAAFAEARGVHGSPRLVYDLTAQGVKACRNTVAKIMQEAGLAARPPKHFVPTTTDSTHTHPIAPNRLNRQFAPGGTQAAWVTDITYIPTGEGWLYLAAVMDLQTRRIVGFSMADHLRVELMIDALHMALGRAVPQAGLVHHSDRGVQYACREYQDLLASRGIVCSMSRTGNCYDNAVMESFWASLKVEEVYRQAYPTHAAARAAIFEYIEVFYNRKRRHSALGYLSPEAFAAQLN